MSQNNYVYNPNMLVDKMPVIKNYVKNMDDHGQDKIKCSTNLQTRTSYIHVDSNQRHKYPSNIYEEQLYSLPPYALHFTNGSKIVEIELPLDHNLKKNDCIAINNVISKNVILNNILMVKKNSFFVRLFHQSHGLSLYGLYDPSKSEEFVKIDYVDNLPTSYNETDDISDGINEYYILKNNSKIDFNVQLSNIKGLDATRSMIGNIPINYLNRKQTVYLLFIKNGSIFEHDPNSYLIILEKKSTINYMDGINFIKDIAGNDTKIQATNTIYIKYHNLFGIPLNYLNSGTPINENMKYPYTNILEITDKFLIIDAGYPAIVDPRYSFYNYSDTISEDIDISKLINSNRGGGGQSFVRKIISTIAGDPEPNSYTYKLDRIYKNVIQARIIGSAFPNSQKIINDQSNDIINNKLYWRNLDDGDFIYQLSVPSGNYSPQQLKDVIEEEFNNTIRYKYTQEYASGIFPTIIEHATPLNNFIYDDNGYNKYHIIDVSISEITDEVSFASYKELILTSNADGPQILTVPDQMIEFTMAEDLRINFGINQMLPMVPVIIPQIIKPFNPENGDVLFIYFTPNIHIRISDSFPYANYNLYKYIKHIQEKQNGFNTFLAGLDMDQIILVNFYRTKNVYPFNESTNEIKSINTTTLLNAFTYNHLTREVYKPNHSLKIGTLIITDQFIDPTCLNELFVYEIDNIIDPNKFTVKKYEHGEKYKFIYDGIIINFDEPKNEALNWDTIIHSHRGSEDSVFFLDQIEPDMPIEPINPSEKNMEFFRNNTLSFTTINPLSDNKILMVVYHPDHQLKIGDKIIISNSPSINQVPAKIINKTHIINKILDNNHYQIILDKYIPTQVQENFFSNIISIKYPNIFQMFFNFQDTLGNLLSFNKVGEEVAITPYKHIINNNDPYMNDYDYDYDYGYSILGQEHKQKLKKLDMTGYNYFYISCPELATIQNTKPVQNVFAIIRWFDNPGNVVFDSFVPSVKIFNSPLSSLSELHIIIKHPDGRLVEFNGLNHSFIIEIVEL